MLSPYSENVLLEILLILRWMIVPSENGPFRSRNPLGLFDPLSNTIARPVKKFLVFHSWHFYDNSII